ncbi:ECF RNA polymerase sigma factor SigW [Dyadobacter sp. CECT 9275]|uniref:ECF RNA polymerase sigma factor SigW n=1 Tax=Dyadobacter helix TaxID=2822344 RepID=A0A916JDH2_9BACT|nr:RNA polymerase sigma-70 factor [Dyadobacter sp. CECT 9275]CAG5003367.1 ECF RNA polymerase sigma factor SigW [Dyadobacter sp. CECT 9275]
MRNDYTTDISTIKIDEDSFVDIYNLYWEKVFSVCYANLGDEEPAKGMVQEIFKSLWERKDQLEITQSVERYLLRSAKLKVFEYIRNKKIREQHHESIAARQVQAVNYTENEVMLSSLSDRLRSLIETLPGQCRKVFRMSREDGLSNKEIASALFISERAVEYHITKAVTSLKSRLTEYSF